MDALRPASPFSDRPEGFLDGGHCWLREYVTGGIFTVRMAESGLLEFSGPGAAFDENLPWPYRPAVAALREDLDRETFRNAVDDVTQYAFSVLAPLGMGVAYDWERMPAVFGRAIWDDAAGAHLPIDDAERIFAALGLGTVPIVEKEVPTRDLQVDASIVPQSAYASAPAAGVVLEKKHGAAVVVPREPFSDHERSPPSPAGQPADLAAWVETELDRERLAELAPDQPLAHWDVDALVETVAAEVARREFRAVGKVAIEDPEEFEAAVRERIVALRTDSDGT